MAILITPETKVLVQGITGDFGGRHAKLSLDYGTKIVAGVTPGKGGQFFIHENHKVPIFNTVKDAVKATGAPSPPSLCRRPLPPTPSSKASMPDSTSLSPSPKAFRSRIWFA